MKRIGCLIAALSLLMTLSACHTGGEAEQTLRIGVALYQQEDTFIETVTRELQRVALEKEQAQNCKINLYITDGKESQTSQNEQVDRFLADFIQPVLDKYPQALAGAGAEITV